MTSDLCKILDIKKPILSAPMAGAAGSDMVAAVCNAGGYGVIPLWMGSVDDVHAGINATRKLTDKNFAVNINLGFDFKDQLQACIDAQVHAVSLFWGFEPAAIDAAKSAGIKVLFSVSSAAEAKAAADAGADVIIAQGWEAGGHVWGRVSTMALIPAVVDAVDIPVVAAGGIADGRGMAAALTLGASGVWIGTRFLASQEATIHQTYQNRILHAAENQTEWYADLYDVGWPNAPHRALINETSANWHAAGNPKLGDRADAGQVVGARPTGEDIVRYQSYTPKPGTTGDVADMSLWAGQGVGLVKSVQPAAVIVDEIFEDARLALKKGAERAL